MKLQECLFSVSSQNMIFREIHDGFRCTLTDIEKKSVPLFAVHTSLGLIGGWVELHRLSREQAEQL